MFKNILVAISLLCSLPSFAVDPAEVKKLLETTGLPVEIHGAVPEQKMFVITHRNPQNFFDFLHLSAFFEDQKLEAEFSSFKRHDKVLLWGHVHDNPSPQIHIQVTRFELQRKHESQPELPDYQYSEKFPEELLEKTSAEFLVHSVAAEGRILVLEYKDHVVPVYVKDNQLSLTKNLYRNDLVRVKFRAQKHPGQPTHLRLSTDADAVEVLEKVLPKHGQAADLEGELVLFPKSPQVSFNVYAVLEKLPFGLQRQYTLVNFDNPEEFQKMRQKLDAAWESDPQSFINGRNKLIHTKLRVRARGMYNVVDANQANVQILLQKVEDLEIK